MLQNKNILSVAIFISAFSSCIDPFYPNLGSKSEAKYVVWGQITDQEGYQIISVSMSSSIKNPKYNPLSGCMVKIIDNLGNTFDLVEFEKGNYRVWMEKSSLVPGRSYRVDVVTSTGDEIISDFDQMPECPEIDSIYYIRENIATSNPNYPQKGIQFYVDLDATQTNSHYFRWDVVETWEHHAAFPIFGYWDGKNTKYYNPPDYSMFYCWSTENVPNIYTLSTKYLTQNQYSRYKLHFVDNTTQRLTYCYSILVNQCALSEASYNYWEKLRINSSEQGGLYEKQPLHFLGNLKCTTSPQMEVLGFFSAIAMRSKRLIIRHVENLELFYLECGPTGLRLFPGEPAYLARIPGPKTIIVEDFCVLCNYFGGETVKPDYWPY